MHLAITSFPFPAGPRCPRRGAGLGEDMMFEFKRYPIIFRFLRKSARECIFEETLLRLALSFRAKARNLVSAPPSRTSYRRLAAQSVNHIARNDLVTQASSARYFVLKSDCPIRNLIHLLVRPFSLWEKVRMRENKYIFTRPPHLSPLLEGEGIIGSFLMTASDFGGK